MALPFLLLAAVALLLDDDSPEPAAPHPATVPPSAPPAEASPAPCEGDHTPDKAGLCLDCVSQCPQHDAAPPADAGPDWKGAEWGFPCASCEPRARAEALYPIPAPAAAPLP